MSAEVLAATQLVVDAWVLLVAAASIVVTVLITVLGTGLTIAFQLGGRIDHQSEEIAQVRERVARLEVLFGGQSQESGLEAEPPTAHA